MDKSGNSSEAQCVGRLEVVRPPVGFLCGSIPVPTDKSFHVFESALVPSSQTVSAPRYRMLPTETDLNTPPLVSNLSEKVLQIDYRAMQSRAAKGDVCWDSAGITHNLARKGEALAVSGLADYSDEIDVIAPAYILKQIFKMPYSKAGLSIAVHRIGETLVLNAGPDVEEGERLGGKKQPKGSDESLFSNFAMHSVRVEACDCPPSYTVPMGRKSNSSVLPDISEPKSSSFQSSGVHRKNITEEARFNMPSDYAGIECDNLYWQSKKNRNEGRDPVKKASLVGERSRCSVKESEKYRRGGNDEFLSVLFWQFHNFRMLLGSDLLLFSNEKYAAVSLHLWDVSRQVTPMTWLEAWLDNFMASVPELAICYHQNGVVQGYELLKTNEILLKGKSEDGTLAFYPYVVQKNGLSVLRFLQENCKRDPGAYWLYKSAGEDVIQLFDLSVIPEDRPSDNCDDSSGSLPGLIRRGRTECLLSLGVLLYRAAHRLSLSMVPNSRARCARFFRKCFELLDEPDHLIIRALVHEQYARLILNNDEVDASAEAVRWESEIVVTDIEEESMDIISVISESTGDGSYIIEEGKTCRDFDDPEDPISSISVEFNLKSDAFDPRSFMPVDITESKRSGENLQHDGCNGNLAVCNIPSTFACTIEAISDPISSKLAAVHHVSQAIKSLRWKRQLQGTEEEPPDVDDDADCQLPSFSTCACGNPDCIEVCDIREWLSSSKLDQKLWKLVLLLGESYLALSEAYKEDGQLLQALKVVEIACSVYGSVPQHLDDTRFFSSMFSFPASWPRLSNEHGTCIYNDCVTPENFSSIYFFWAKAWMLVGDMQVEFYMMQDVEISGLSRKKPSGGDLRMSSEVVEELIRLKKKLSQDSENCSICSLINCSCQSDRASSGNSASSSTSTSRALIPGRRQIKRSSARNAAASVSGNLKDESGSLLRNKDEGPSVKGSISIKDENDRNTSSPVTLEREECVLSFSDEESKMEVPVENTSKGYQKVRSGGIFQYLRGPVGAGDEILSAALSCYEEARKAVNGLPTGLVEVKSVFKKIGWVCNELGRNRLEKKDLPGAELVFSNAIDAFKEVSDHANIILINCNLGHGRRALAEELVSKMEYFKANSIFRNAYEQALETAKMEYNKSLRFYGAAKSELDATPDGACDVSVGLRNEVYTQFAHTYLRLGMLLAREDTVAAIYGYGALDDIAVEFDNPSDTRNKKEFRKHEISANDAIREALSVYESLGELRRQEASFAYFQLACYQRDCCLKFLDSNHRSNTLAKGESSVAKRVKQYASLAQRNWLKSMEFYTSKTHHVMYITILIERSALFISLSSYFHSHMMLENALSCLLEGRHICEETCSDAYSEVYSKFWSQLQMLLKKMLASTLAGSNKSNSTSQSTSSRKSGDADKLRELYKVSLVSNDFSQLCAMHNLWTS